ncbi:MAG: peptide-methionine (S)-S-oxide reductase MsrA, partial [Erysipelotrichaceae bacterium]|nr:peptide-methionine (S)-S-oxide reductase MsrA [Erysipelotrichaceae bacterium]
GFSRLGTIGGIKLPGGDRAVEQLWRTGISMLLGSGIDPSGLYDEEKISLQEILSLFFEIIDPTLVDQQGHDIGHQYRTGIYYVDEKDIPIIQDALKELSRQYDKPIVTELLPLENFTIAEDYHQDYLIKNPEGYCHVPFKMFDRAKNYKKN